MARIAHPVHPLKRLAQVQQRDTLHRLVRTTESSVRATFARAKASVTPAIANFASAYYAERQRLTTIAELEPADGAAPVRVPLHWLVASGWHQQVPMALATAVRTAGHESLTHVTVAQQQAALAGETGATDLVTHALRPAINAGMPASYAPVSALSVVHTRIIGKAGNGAPLASLFDRFDAEAAKKGQSVLSTALVTGTNPRQAASQLVNVLDISLSRALIIARNELIGAYVAAQNELYRANADVLDGWMWSADNPSACAACIFMDGSLHGLDENLDDHVCGKCSALPITKSWDAILGPLGIDASDLPDTRITAGYQSGEDWFAEQDAATQREILGPAKYNAMQAGDITLSDLVGQRADGAWGNPVYEKSLKELGLDASDYLD